MSSQREQVADTSNHAELDDGARSWLDDQLAALAATPTTPRPPTTPNESSPVDPRLLRLLEIVEQRQASSLHLAAGQVPHIRIRGTIEPLLGVDPFDSATISVMLRSALDPSTITSLDRELSAHTVMTLPAAGRVAVSVDHGAEGMSGAMRLLPTAIPSLDSLGLPAALGGFAGSRQGLLLVGGTRRSGVSTTIAALVDSVIAHRPVRIVTIEDPIEYLFPDRRAFITQRQVGSDVSTFAAGVTQAHHHDPDVVVIGNLDTPEAIGAALEAARSGQFVLAGAPGDGVRSMLTNLIESFHDQSRACLTYQLSEVLVGVVNQQLVPDRDDGVVVVTELAEATMPIRRMIRRSELHRLLSTLDADRPEKMHSMDRCLAILAERGAIEFATARNYCRDPQSLQAHWGKLTKSATTGT